MNASLGVCGQARNATADAAAKKAIAATLKQLNTAAALVPDTCDNANTILDLLDIASPRMIADAKRDADNPDPCAIAPDSEYRGRENQLYRVEIHRPGLAGPTGPATFKWSRENASVAFRVIDIAADPTTGKATTQVTLENLGRDRRTGVCEGDWVELVDDDSEFQWQSLTLLQVARVDAQHRSVILTGVAETTVNPARHALMRRWDHTPDDKAGGAIFVRESKTDTDWIDLERGVRIQLANSSAGCNRRRRVAHGRNHASSAEAPRYFPPPRRTCDCQKGWQGSMDRDAPVRMPP